MVEAVTQKTFFGAGGVRETAIEIFVSLVRLAQLERRGGVWEGKLEEQSTHLTRFGRILKAMMADRGVSGLSELARLSKEAGYEVDEAAIRREMFSSSARGRVRPGSLEGPASVLG